jgi:hypothetical protein
MTTRFHLHSLNRLTPEPAFFKQGALQPTSMYPLQHALNCFNRTNYTVPPMDPEKPRRRRVGVWGYPRFYRGLSLAALLYPALGQAIIVRHDVADSAYQQLALQERSTVSFMRPRVAPMTKAPMPKAPMPKAAGTPPADGSPAVANSAVAQPAVMVVEGTGTLVAADWVLTAAHVAHHLKIGDAVSYQQRDYRIARIDIHPSWRPQQVNGDIALVRLQQPIADAEIAQLYSATDEQGKVLTLVGRGDVGDGLRGVVAGDALLRAAHNQVIASQQQWLQFRFDQGAAALPLEGISGPGDSGGPALLRQHGQLWVLGVSAWQDASATDWQEGKYGVIEHYSRVSHYHAWLRSILASANTSPRNAAAGAP